ncbi:peptidoglycan-binding protein LysM [Alsobacter soli]|uniref:Peptidoglycan-binding protein LysM n=1 Tax=Alsobacter soli TaxID=2109933 RepID=A0A2T1HU54_9HYPH|nr:peptidoglycan-binding protein LysM [Alsobacter soli]PSC05185.1 peptidoglycan-binding protein LysM [Alsobacter soli]
MGLFKFIKDAGEKLFGASPSAAATPEALQQEVAKHGLQAQGLQVSVEGDKVKVSGNAMSTADAEKIILALGNTQGVAEVQSDLIVNKETPPSNMYTVAKGDTLWAIAEKEYGKGKGAHYTEIFEANKPMLTHPDKIYPGQVLRIPPLA